MSMLSTGKNLFEKGRAGVAKLSATDDDWGFRVWLNTPVDGLRVGVSHHGFTVNNGLVVRPGGRQRLTYASFDFDRDRFLARVEAGRGLAQLPFIEADLEVVNVTLGFSPLARFWVYLQSESRHVALTPKVQPDQKSFESVGVSLTYNISERVVVKAEHHDITTSDLDRVLRPGELPEVKATIVSLSVAF